MKQRMETDQQGYDRVVGLKHLTVRDLDLDSFAAGVVAHQAGLAFHDNPHRFIHASLLRLSWAHGWNERALQRP